MKSSDLKAYRERKAQLTRKIKLGLGSNAAMPSTEFYNVRLAEKKLQQRGVR